MSSEKLNAKEATGAALTRRGEVIEAIDIVGTFHAELVRDGKVIWRDTFENLVTTQGKNAMLDKFLGLGAAYAAISIGLHTTVGDANSTYAAPSPQVESVVYSNATRGVPAFSAASAGAKATSAAVAFTINGSATVSGAFCAIGAAGVTTKSDTAAAASVLLSSGPFSGGSRAVISGDTLNVTYSLALALVMSLRDDIEAVYADATLDDAQKRALVYRIKTTALVAEIKRRLLDRPYTHNGASYLIREVMAGPADQLIFGLLVNGTKHTVHITNPPLIPRNPTGNERRDMRRAVRQMLEGLGV